MVGPTDAVKVLPKSGVGRVSKDCGLVYGGLGVEERRRTDGQDLLVGPCRVDAALRTACAAGDDVCDFERGRGVDGWGRAETRAVKPRMGMVSLMLEEGRG